MREFRMCCGAQVPEPRFCMFCGGAPSQRPTTAIGRFRRAVVLQDYAIVRLLEHVAEDVLPGEYAREGSGFPGVAEEAGAIVARLRAEQS